MTKLVEKKLDISDMELLRTLLNSGLLLESELKAFSAMLWRLEEGKFDSLTARQREWTEDVYDKYDLQSQEGAKNLISSGKYVPTSEERVKKYSWESMPKPLKPPGR